MVWCNSNSYCNCTGNPIYGPQDLEQTATRGDGVDIRTLAITLHSADSDALQALVLENRVTGFPASFERVQGPVEEYGGRDGNEAEEGLGL